LGFYQKYGRVYLWLNGIDPDQPIRQPQKVAAASFTIEATAGKTTP
jgi:hypothetical protein